MDARAEGVSTIHCNLRKLLAGRKRGLRAFEICNLYFNRYKKRYSDAAMTARFREMQDIVCNLSGYTYMLVEVDK